MVGPTLFINPRTDDAFRILVHELFEAGDVSPEGLQQALRRSYPDAVVRRRVLSGETLEIWYVFRDGRWVPSAAGDAADAGSGV